MLVLVLGTGTGTGIGIGTETGTTTGTSTLAKRFSGARPRVCRQRRRTAESKAR